MTGAVGLGDAMTGAVGLGDTMTGAVGLGEDERGIRFDSGGVHASPSSPLAKSPLPPRHRSRREWIHTCVRSEMIESPKGNTRSGATLRAASVCGLAAVGSTSQAPTSIRAHLGSLAMPGWPAVGGWRWRGCVGPNGVQLTELRASSVAVERAFCFVSGACKCLDGALASAESCGCVRPARENCMASELGAEEEKVPGQSGRMVN